MKRTKSKKNYITRLAIFAIISQIPYILMIKGIPSTSLTETTELEKVLKVFNHFTSLFNVGFTLLLGAITIYVLEKSKYNNTYNVIYIYIRNIWI